MSKSDDVKPSAQVISLLLDILDELHKADDEIRKKLDEIEKVWPEIAGGAK